MGSLFSTPAQRKLVFGCGAVAALCLLRCAYFNFKASATSHFLGRKEDSTASENQLVFITGCDSGLGFSFALHAYKLGYTVVAGCLQANGAGSTELLQRCPQRLHVLQLDVTSDVSVQTAAETVQEMLAHNPHYGRPTRTSHNGTGSDYSCIISLVWQFYNILISKARIRGSLKFLFHFNHFNM